jgi:hypothetical protein
VRGEGGERRRDVSKLQVEIPFVLLLFPFKTAYLHAYACRVAVSLGKGKAAHLRAKR